MARSALTLGAVEGGTAALDDPPDAAATIAGGTGFALASIDGPMVLEISELAGGLHIIAQARAAGGDGAFQCVADGMHEPLGPRPAHGFGDAPRRKARPVETL